MSRIPVEDAVDDALDQKNVKSADVLANLSSANFRVILEVVKGSKVRFEGIAKDIKDFSFRDENERSEFLINGVEDFFEQLQSFNKFELHLFEIPSVGDLLEDDDQVKVDVFESYLQQFLGALSELEQALEERLKSPEVVVETPIDPYAPRVGDRAAAGVGGYGEESLDPAALAQEVEKARQALALQNETARNALLVAEKVKLTFSDEQKAELDALRLEVGGFLEKFSEESNRARSGSVLEELAKGQGIDSWFFGGAEEEGGAIGAAVMAVTEEGAKDVVDKKASLQDLQKYCQGLSEKSGEASTIEAKNAELIEVSTKIFDFVEALKKERSKHIENITKNYEKLASEPELRSVKAITDELNADLQYLRDMPSISLLESNLVRMNGLIVETFKLRSKSTYNSCYNSILGIASKAIAPFVEFGERHDDSVAVESSLTLDDIRKRDENTYLEVEKLVLEIQDTIYDKNFRDQITKIVNGKNSESRAEEELKTATTALNSRMGGVLGSIDEGDFKVAISKKISGLRSQKFELLEGSFNALSADIVAKDAEIRQLKAQQNIDDGKIRIARHNSLIDKDISGNEESLKAKRAELQVLEERGKTFFGRIFYKPFSFGARKRDMAQISAAIVVLESDKAKFEQEKANLASLHDASDESAASILRLETEVAVLRSVLDSKESIREVAKWQEVKRLKDEYKLPSTAPQNPYQPSADEQALLATSEKSLVYDKALLVRGDVSKVVDRMENVHAKREVFSDILSTVLNNAFARAEDVRSGIVEADRSTTRKFVGLGFAIARMAGGPAEPAIRLAGVVLDGILKTWGDTSNNKVCAVVDALGKDGMGALIAEISKRVSDLYANDGSTDAAFNRFNKEATLYGLAANIAVSVIEAIGNGDVNLANRRPNSSDIETDVAGVKGFKKDSLISQYVDDVISKSLARSNFSEHFKPTQKLIGGRTTTEESARGNITAMGAKQGVGIEFIDDNGNFVRLVPESRRDAKYGFRKATEGEKKAYRDNMASLDRPAQLLSGYVAYDSLENRYQAEFKELLGSIIKVGGPRDEVALADTVSRIVIFFADQKQYVFNDKSGVVALKTYATTQGITLTDDMVRIVGRLSDIYNEATSVRTKKGLRLGSIKIDLAAGAALAVQTVLGNQQVMNRIGNVDPFTGQPLLVKENIDAITIGDVFKTAVIEPHRTVLGQMKIFLEKQLNNPDFNFLIKPCPITLVPNPETGKIDLAGQILEDIATIMEINAEAMSKRPTIIEEKLKDMGLFNLNSEINKKKFEALKNLAGSLVAIEMAFRKDHNKDEDKAYLRHNSSQRQYEARLSNLSKLVFGAETLATPTQQAGLEAMIGVCANALRAANANHDKGEVRKTFQRQLDDFCLRHGLAISADETKKADLLDSLGKTADAFNLKEQVVVGRGYGFIVGAVEAARTIGDIRDGGKVKRGIVVGARRFVNIFKDKTRDLIAAELKPSYLDKDSAIAELKNLLSRNIQVSQEDSLIVLDRNSHGSVEERVERLSGKIVQISQEYSASLVKAARERSGIDDKSFEKILSNGVSLRSLSAYLNGVDEFKSIININSGTSLHNDERTKLLSLVADLVKHDVRGITRETGQVQAFVASEPVVRKTFAERVNILAAELGISTVENKNKLQDIITNYVDAVEKNVGEERRFNKYGRMLAIQLRDLSGYPSNIIDGVIYAGPLSSCIEGCKLDKAEGKIASPTIEQLKERIGDAIGGLQFNREFYSSIADRAMFASGAEIVSQASLEAKQALLDLAASPDFAAKSYDSKKAEVEKYFDKGVNETNAVGHVKNWSEPRLRFDALLDAVINLSEEHQRQVAPVVTAVSSAAVDSVFGGASASAGGVGAVRAIVDSAAVVPEIRLGNAFEGVAGGAGVDGALLAALNELNDEMKKRQPEVTTQPQTIEAVVAADAPKSREGDSQSDASSVTMESEGELDDLDEGISAVAAVYQEQEAKKAAVPAHIAASATTPVVARTVSMIGEIGKAIDLLSKCSERTAGSVVSNKDPIMHMVNFCANMLERGEVDEGDKKLKKEISQFIDTTSTTRSDIAKVNAALTQIKQFAEALNRGVVNFDQDKSDLHEPKVVRGEGGSTSQHFDQVEDGKSKPANAFSLSLLQELHDILSDNVKPNKIHVQFLVGELKSAINLGVSGNMSSSSTGAGHIIFSSSDDNLLHIAAKNGHLDAVKVLIGGGARFSNSSALDPLRASLQKGHTEVAKFLIESGAPIIDVPGAPLFSLVKSNDVRLALVAKGVPGAEAIPAIDPNVEKERASRKGLDALVEGLERKPRVYTSAVKDVIENVIDHFVGSIKLAGGVRIAVEIPEDAREEAKKLLGEVVNIGKAGAFVRGGRDANRMKFDEVCQRAFKVAQVLVAQEREVQKEAAKVMAKARAPAASPVAAGRPSSDVEGPKASNLITGRAVTPKAQGTFVDRVTHGAGAGVVR